MKALRRLRDLFLGPPSEPGPDDLVVLGRPAGEAEAELWRNILEQWGVRALVRNVSSLAYIRLGDMYEVLVLRRDVAYARSLVGLDDIAEDEAAAP